MTAGYNQVPLQTDFKCHSHTEEIASFSKIKSGGFESETMPQARPVSAIRFAVASCSREAPFLSLGAAAPGAQPADRRCVPVRCLPGAPASHASPTLGSARCSRAAGGGAALPGHSLTSVSGGTTMGQVAAGSSPSVFLPAPDPRPRGVGHVCGCSCGEGTCPSLSPQGFQLCLPPGAPPPSLILVGEEKGKEVETLVSEKGTRYKVAWAGLQGKQ